MIGDNPGFSKRFNDALNLSVEVHRYDVRKGTDIPYIAHLLSVCSLVLYDGGNEVEAIAALLHDTLEDHPEMVTAESLEGCFGFEVRSIVEACSDTPPHYKGGQKPPWRERKEGYIKHLHDLFHAVANPLKGNQDKDPQTMNKDIKFAEQVLRVSLADKLDNVRSMVVDYRVAIRTSPAAGESFWNRFNAGKAEQLWYLESLRSVFDGAHRRIGTCRFLLEEFHRSTVELKALVNG